MADWEERRGALAVESKMQRPVLMHKESPIMQLEEAQLLHDKLSAKAGLPCNVVFFAYICSFSFLSARTTLIVECSLFYKQICSQNCFW